MANVNQDERIRREGTDALQALIEERVDDRAIRLRHCLMALRVAGIDLDLTTASVLHEMADYMVSVIQDALGSDPS